LCLSYELKSVLAMDERLKHVGHVKNGDMLPGVKMGTDDPRFVLYRHVEAGKGNHLGSLLHMELVEDGLPEAGSVACIPREESQFGFSAEAPAQFLRDDHGSCRRPRGLYR